MNVLQNTMMLKALLAVAGLGMVACLTLFAHHKNEVGGTYLDLVVSLEKANDLVKKLTPEQIERHLHTTRVIDSVFPVCYGLALASITLLTIPYYSAWLVLPVSLAILADFGENWTHIKALENREVPRLKPWFSCLKWLFIIVALSLPVFHYLVGK